MNGWTNRQTWLVHLHEFFDQEFFDENMFETIDEAEIGMHDAFVEWLHDETRDLSPFLQDFITTEDIAWRELAEHYYDDWVSNRAEDTAVEEDDDAEDDDDGA
jgi:hypothetical protein